MRFRVVRHLTDSLKDSEKTRIFMEMVELRQRLFRTHKETLLILDAYDLISDHILLYSEKTDTLIGYIRSIPASRCAKFEMPFPMEALVRPRPEYALAYSRFLQHTVDPVHMGYLCFDPDYKDELRGMKAIDLAVWIGLVVSDVPREKLGFAATINNRYKQDASMRLLGEWVPDLPDLDHPVVADRHRVILVPQIAEGYWDSQYRKFKAAYETLGDEKFDLLREDIKIAA